MDNYAIVMNDTKLTNELKLKNVITRQQEVKTVLPPEKLRIILYQGRPFVEKRQ